MSLIPNTMNNCLHIVVHRYHINFKEVPVFLCFTRKQALTFQSVKTCFLGKNKKNILNFLSVECSSENGNDNGHFGTLDTKVY